MSKAQGTKYLREYLSNKLIVYCILFAMGLSLITGLAYFGNQNTKKLSLQIYPLYYQLIQLRGNLRQNSTSLQVLLHTNQNLAKAELYYGINTLLPRDIAKTKYLLKKVDLDVDFMQFEKAYNVFRWSEWKILDVRNLSNQSNNSYLYDKSLTDIYNKINHNFMYGVQSSKIINRNYYKLYAMFLRESAKLSLYLNANNFALSPVQIDDLVKLKKYNSTVIPTNELEKSMQFLISKYIVLAERKIDLKNKSPIFMLQQQMQHNFFPNQKLLLNILNSYIEKVAGRISDMQRNIYSIEVFTIINMVILIIATILLGISFIRNLILLIVHPLEKLTSSMRAIAKGGTNIGVKHSKITEIVRLVSSIKMMLKERKSYEINLINEKEEVQYLAYHDLNLRVYNYQYFLKSLGNETIKSRDLKNSQRIAVFYYVIQKIEDIYNSLGQEKGDSFIREYSHALSRVVSGVKAFSSVRSHSFVGYLPIGEKLNFGRIYKELQKGVDAKSIDLEFDIDLKFSVGIAIYPDHARDILRLTDYAQFSALKGANSDELLLVFNEKDKAQLDFKSSLRQDFAQALNKKEFFLMFQPQYRLENKKVIGCEVLVRWQHPHYNLISPNEFIYLAEESNYIIELGKYVQESAIQQAVKWLPILPKGFKFAINASLIEILSGKYVDNLISLLNTYNLDPSYIEVELLESMASEYFDLINDKISKLHTFGISVSLDDFGTGYSSLSRLKNLNIDLIKIDKSFLEGLQTSVSVTQLLEVIVNLAQVYKIPTLVEGIETQAELDELKKIGCIYGQGYFLSKPLNEDDMHKLLKKL